MKAEPRKRTKHSNEPVTPKIDLPYPLSSASSAVNVPIPIKNISHQGMKKGRARALPNRKYPQHELEAEFRSEPECRWILKHLAASEERIRNVRRTRYTQRDQLGLIQHERTLRVCHIEPVRRKA